MILYSKVYLGSKRKTLHSLFPRILNLMRYYWSWVMTEQVRKQVASEAKCIARGPKNTKRNINWPTKDPETEL